MTELTLHLPLPPPLSACFKNVARNGRAATPRYLAWQQLAYLKARPQMNGSSAWPFIGDVAVEYQLGKPDRRKQDIANREKGLSDLLVKLDVLMDDSQIVDLRMRWADVDGAVITVKPA